MKSWTIDQIDELFGDVMMIKVENAVYHGYISVYRVVAIASDSHYSATMLKNLDYISVSVFDKLGKLVGRLGQI